jgi:hypothetical protein
VVLAGRAAIHTHPNRLKNRNGRSGGRRELLWNARGAADIAKLEIELLSRNTNALEGPLTRALRTIDRHDDGA